MASDATNNGEIEPLLSRSMLVLFGSETGNSEEIATELGKMAERLHFSTVVEEMNEVPLVNLRAFTLIVFVTSTTGQGDMPANASKFWKSLLRKRLPADVLSSINFTLFGLGDSSYPKFNWAARKLHKRLQQLGAQEVFSPGEGDERHDDGIDSIYLPWSQEFRTWLLAHYPLPETVFRIPEDVPLPAKYLLRLGTEMNVTPSPAGEAERRRQFMENREKSAALSHIDRPRTSKEQLDDEWDRMSANFFGVMHLARRSDALEKELLGRRRVDTLDRDNILKDAPAKYLLEPQSDRRLQSPPNTMLPVPGGRVAMLRENIRVTSADHWQDVRFLSFSVVGTKEQPIGKPFPGSTLTIYPKNFPEDVQVLIDRMGWGDVADSPLEWSNERLQDFTPSPTALSAPRHCPRNLHTFRGATLRDLFMHNLDFTAIPKRSFISDISYYAKSERERERLLELVKPGNSQEFYDYTSRPRRTILELLQDFPSVKLPWERAVSLFPVIRGREFSIANGGHYYVDKTDRNCVIVELLVALVEYKTIIRKPRQGLCSRYIKHLEEGACLAVTLSHHERSAPPWRKEDAMRPLIAVATGTGIAPIRSLIQERQRWQEDLPPPQPPQTLLFFGCRNRNADFHFRSEWEDGPYADWVEVVPAFSREAASSSPLAAETATGTSQPYSRVRTDEGHNAPLPTDFLRAGNLAADYDRGRNYVQHLIRAHAARICELLPLNPIICVCGSSGRMPKSVRLALLDAFVMGGVARSVDEADAVLNSMDVWQETW